MLINLYVKNFAIIEDLYIDFKDGMTVLTGETGAGKSLIIDTISLLSGARADSDMIRYGEKKAIIQGVFSYENEKLNDILNRFGIKIEENITIYREIGENSKNIIKVNNSTVTLTMLKSISSLLADIHTQNDTFKLFNPEIYLDMINPNNDDKYTSLLGKYVLLYSKYLDSLKKYNQILKGHNESLSRLEYLEYEKQEISALNLVDEMDVELSQEISKLENYDKIFSSLNESYTYLNGDLCVLDNIYDAANSLKKISSLDKEYEKYEEKILDCYYILDEIKNEISKQINSLDFDADELNDKIEKLNEIEKVKSKYKMNVRELIEYLEEITLKIEMVNNYDAVLLESKNEVIKNYECLKTQALLLSEYRKSLAKNIEKGIVKECVELDLEDTKFAIQFNEPGFKDPFDSKIFLENGVDVVDFLISFNKGEPLKPLQKVASGGEMSRIMLAFKSYFAKKSNLSLMVFDEIDTGVSGATAKKIAKKLRQISSITQLLCITHLPQVASSGKNHIHIFKEVNNNRTKTHFKYLSFDERVEEISMMLSGDKLNLYALEHAKALLKENIE